MLRNSHRSRSVQPAARCFYIQVNTREPGGATFLPLQAWSGTEGYRKLRFPDFVTTAQGGGKVVSLTHRPHLPPGNSLGTHFSLRLSRPQGHSAIGRIMSMKNSNDTIWNRTSDLPICSSTLTTVPPRSPLRSSEG